MTHKGSRVLRTERLVLRPFTEGDAEAVFENWANDSEVTKYLTWTPHQSIEETRAVLRVWEEAAKRPDVYHWAMTIDGRPIGDICLVAVNEQSERGVIGYCMGRKFWGKGLMTEAFRAVLAYLFEEVGFHRIEGTHAVQNPASGRVMEKCGLKYEGTGRKEFRLPSTGEWTDIVHRAVLREDCLSQK